MIQQGSKGAEVRALQHALDLNIDGDYGAKTQAAVEKFQRENDLIPDGIVGLKTWVKLLPILEVKDKNPIDAQVFFTHIKPLFGKFSQVQVDCINILLPLIATQTTNYAAYMLATAYHETAKTMCPIEEYGKGRGHRYGKRIKQDGAVYSANLPIYYGRGYVQLTWYENYERAGKYLELDLIHNPELTLQPEIAYKIMERGMLDGWFTDRKLSHFININAANYKAARQIINGRDRAAKIAKHADVFELALRKARV